MATTPDGAIELYRCTECGKLSVSLGWLHGHIEKHRGYTPLRIQIPFTRTSPGNYEELMKMTDVIEVTEYRLREEPSVVS